MLNLLGSQRSFKLREEGVVPGRWRVLACSLAVLLPLGVSVAVAVPAYAARMVVYPTGAFPADVVNVQAAADHGGTVVLKASNVAGKPTPFNFGPSTIGGGGVNLTGDVTIVGENEGWPRTVISGGWIPLLAYPGSTIRIRGLDLEAPFEMGILVVNPVSAEVSNNRIVHLVGRSQPQGFTAGWAIQSFGGGSISIDRNVIDDVQAQAGFGIEQFRATGATEIAGNRVTGVNTVAIESGGAGPVTIKDNVAIPGPQRAVIGGVGKAIEANAPGTYRIIGNTAVCVNPRAECLQLYGTDDPTRNFGPVVAAIVRDNDITVTTSPADAIDLQGIVRGAVIARNRIHGSAEAAVILVCFAGGPGADLSFNGLVNNDISGFTGDFASFYFDTCAHDNNLKGDCGTVLDDGSNNILTCDGRDQKAAPKASANASARAAGKLAPTVSDPQSGAQLGIDPFTWKGRG